MSTDASQRQRPSDNAKGQPRRVAIVAGLRTPFVKAGTLFSQLSALELATQVVSELLARTKMDPQLIERCIFGQVVGSPAIPNIAREVTLAASLPHHLDAFSVARACATGTQAIVDGTMAILAGDIDVALVGGVDSLSRPPIGYKDKLVDAMMKAQSAKDLLGRAKAFKNVRPADLLPQPPALKEPSTGLTMGQSAEIMAKENGILRSDQDEVAVRSHLKAAKAWEEGIYDQEVMHVQLPPKFDNVVSRDSMVRPDVSREKLASLKPVFDRQHGSITAANASPLTDGAGALLLMERQKALSLGLTPLAYVSSWAFAAVDPNWQLLAAPAISIPKALRRARVGLNDLAYIDIHEAFAAQVLSNLQHLADPAWQQTHAGQDASLGTIAPESINAFGGSIALGHPFAATGIRQALTIANALHRKKEGFGLISQCAAGGLGGSLVLEAAS